MNTGGWIKLYRKTLTSDFWSLNPVARDIFLWLLLSVDHETGTITTSMNNIAQGVSWNEYGVEKRPNRKTVMSYLDYMTELGMLARESNSKWTRVSICNWSTYQHGTSEKVTANGQVIGQVIGQVAYNSVPVEEVQEVQEVQNERGLPLSRSKPIYQPSEEAQKALQSWDNLSPLPTTCDRTSCLKTLDDLVRLDHLTWDRVYRICEHACKEWAPKGFISSPVKLRKRTRTGELMTWESIERQLNGNDQPKKETFEEMEARLLKEGIIGPWSAQKP